jgi:hypothetical protein
MKGFPEKLLATNMEAHEFDTLSEALYALKKVGYIEDFVAEEKYMIILRTKKKYQPEDLKIVRSFRFEGMSNPSDSSELFAIIANDGVKGTLVMAYGAKQLQNTDLIVRIKKVE